MTTHIELHEIPDPERQKNEVNDIHDDFHTQVNLRTGFIRKVYGILLVQLAISLIFISIGILFKDSVMKFVINQPVIMYITAVVSIIICFILSFVKSLARIVPINYILLLLFTISQSYVLMYAAAYYKSNIVLSALAITVACTLGLTVYAWTTKKDFTPLVAWLWAVLFTFVFCGLLFFCFNKNVYILYCGCGVLIYSIYIIIDTQLLLGKFQHEFNTEDYVFAAMNLYLDIINLFIEILKYLGRE